MSLQRTKHETSATDLVGWVEYLRLQREKDLEVDKRDLYFAQLTSEVRRSFIKNPANVRSDDFIIKFDTEKEKEKEKKQQTLEEAAAASKRYWFAITGLKEAPNE